MTAKIEAIDTIALALPFKLAEPAAGFAAADWSKLYMLIVKVRTDDGLTGWGEAFGFNCWRAVKAALDDMVAPVAIGQDAADIAALMHRLQVGLHTYGRYGITLYALSGLDIALWDLAGKRAGRPLHELLGSAGRSKVAGYASLFRYERAASVAAACERWTDAGARFVKLHENNPAVIAAAHAACAPKQARLMLDVNCCWDYDAALANARANAAAELYWLEEPLFPPEDFAGLARLREHAGVPLAAGENCCTAWQFAQLFAAGAVDYAQPSVTKVGGITEFGKVAELARRHGVQLAPHSPYFGAGLLATVHLCAAMEQPAFVEHFCLELEASPFGEHALMRGGAYAVPAGPGLGVDPDPAVIKRYQIAA